MVFGHVLLRGDLRPQTCWRDYISHLAWESLSAPSHPWSSWRRWLRRGSVCSDSCPDDLDADNHQKMNGWLFPEQCFYFFTISIHKALFDLFTWYWKVPCKELFLDFCFKPRLLQRRWQQFCQPCISVSRLHADLCQDVRAVSLILP